MFGRKTPFRLPRIYSQAFFRALCPLQDKTNVHTRNELLQTLVFLIFKSTRVRRITMTTYPDCSQLNQLNDFRSFHRKPVCQCNRTSTAGLFFIDYDWSGLHYTFMTDDSECSEEFDAIANRKSQACEAIRWWLGPIAKNLYSPFLALESTFFIFRSRSSVEGLLTR